MRSIRGRMIRQDRASAFFFTTLITVIIFMPISIQGQQSEVCCTEKEFDLFLIGEPDEGILSPFYSDLESDAKEVKVTSSIGGEVKIATWDVIWQTEGEYEAGTWSFSIPYKLEGATGFTLNATLELKVGGNTYEGSLNMPDILITGEGILEIPIDIVQGEISEGDNLEVTLSVQNLVFSSPGEDTGIFFLWGSEEYEGSITV
ncbi:MAG: hypothetical protein ACI9SZ_000075, partial [Candidatus Thalassarchaeaceae archaeon]